ncbi:FAD-dependent thymidylate synthase [Marinivivus vitaminiproducens]|uniref:FAD-dependent thymidylate synthase n=1 Tax=Marinivivus vitaminiproducens TaxID=3035935 RepID=UPI0027A34F86|nr:FAD-dependent thymidylate synthase [Geminicoccaceae bacterium SCSIO 64248]
MTVSEEQAADIERQRAEQAPTRRATVPAMEEILYRPLPVLDHGFIRVIDYMGDDSAIVQAARVSYGRGTRAVRDDAGLIRYLIRHRHSSPFEMCEIKLHVKLPIFVARQWIRHRTANVNEISARYSILDDQVYIPLPEHLAAQSSDNRQGRGETLPSDQAEAVRAQLRAAGERAYELYSELLNEADNGHKLAPGRDGLSRELARMVLPLNVYTQWYWKTDLHNLLQFVSLRADPHAQYEIRAYAEVLQDVLRRWVPLTWDAFQDCRIEGASLSGTALAVVRRLLAGEEVTRESSGLSAREYREVMATLGRS